jgi:hypothetical protein
MIIALTSSNQGQVNFQFVGDIYANGNLITRMKVPVNPDGYGVFDIHRHIENNVSFDFDPVSDGWFTATGSFCTYSVNFSEEFRFEWPFVDNSFSSGSLAFISQVEPLFEVGDTVFVSQTEPYTNISYNGLCDIIAITQSGLTWSVVTNKTFGASSPVEGGTMSLANFGLNIISTTYSIEEQYAWNGVNSFQDFINYDENDYIPATASLGEWVTRVPQNWEVSLDSRMKLLTYRDNINKQTEIKIRSNNGVYTMTSETDNFTYGSSISINTYTNNGGFVRFNCFSAHGLLLGDTFEVFQSPYNGVYTVIEVNSTTQVTGNVVYTTGGVFGAENLRKITGGGNTSDNLLRMAAVGPYELLTYTSSISAGTYSFPILDSNTATYSIWTVNSSGVRDLEEQVFTIKDFCSRYEKIQLIFMDKLGSFIPYTFNKVNRENRNISRTNYQQRYGSYAPASQNWGYNTWDRGKKSLDTVVTETYTVNSDWVNQSTSDFLMELFESPQVYWIGEDGLTQAINITSNSTERKQTINDQIINYTLTFELSNKNMSQRG